MPESLIRILTWLDAVYAKYFDNFRFKEFSYAVSGAFLTIRALAESLSVPAMPAYWLSAIAALIAAICYIRIPKHPEAVPSPAPESTGQKEV